MVPICFSPGPAAVYPSIAQYLTDAYAEGWLSISHRGGRFTELSQALQRLLRARLGVPGDYSIFYVSSATESWEILAQSLTVNRSQHFYNGSFGKKWWEYAKAINPASIGVDMGIEHALTPDQLPIDAGADLLCFTQNETSNGTQIPFETLMAVKAAHPDKLLAVDATSSMNGLALPIAHADVWFASVQKCFGMPAGLGLLICSPLAIERARAIGELGHYNSLLTLVNHMRVYETSYTPSVLHLYLLKRVLETLPSIEETDAVLRTRAAQWYQLVDEHPLLRPLIANETLRSTTVVPIEINHPDLLAKIYADSASQGMILGRGYGVWKAHSFRIANFPALSDADVAKGMDFIRSWTA